MLLVHLRAADRWERLAAVLPGRTVAAGSIEAGFVPFPRYGGCGLGYGLTLCRKRHTP
jgi:hypothetical protein